MAAPLEPGLRAAYRVETDRLVLRCWEPGDAPALREALDRSDRHLRPWIPFMKDEPRDLQGTATWLRSLRARFDLDQDYRYGVFTRDSGELVGESMLLRRVGPGALEIGYWTALGFERRGYAVEAAAALVRLAFEAYGVERIEIHCVPENRASAAIPPRLGFRHEATLAGRTTDTTGAVHDLMVWSLFSADHAGAPVARTGVSAFDCLGAAILED